MKENYLSETNSNIQQIIDSNNTLQCIQPKELKFMKEPSNKIGGKLNNNYSNRTSNNDIYYLPIKTKKITDLYNHQEH